jgi:SAM-dependent methyltransferase
MLKALFDVVMERRARRLLEQVGEWIPDTGPVLDIGSGTGHLPALLHRERGLDVVTADVSDMHVTGPAPVLIEDGMLPFGDDAFPAALLFFMLAYPKHPGAVLREAARVSRGPIILVQSVYSGRVGHAWHRGREFVWTLAAFHIAKLIGYVPAQAEFTMRTQRFYTAHELTRDVVSAGLHIRSRRERAVLPGGALVVVAWLLECDD